MLSMKTKSCLFLTFLSMFIGSGALALTPPMSPQTLEKEADAVVQGEVGEPVQCLGRVEQTSCADKLRFAVPLKIKKVLKGLLPAGETVKIIFYYLDYSKSSCVGDQYAVLHTGDQGTYYLKKAADGAYSPVHWSGAQVKVTGSGTLPKCP